MTTSKQIRMKDPEWFMIRESLIQIIETDPDGSEILYPGDSWKVPG